MEQKNKNLLLIQVLRGVASLLVVFYHITGYYATTFGKPFLANVFAFGGSGVDIFFVLSGFIITYTNLHNINQPAAVGTFIKRRFIRIFPVYWILITVFIAVQLLLPQFYKTGYPCSVHNIINTYLLLPDHQMVNGVSWSLTNELFFYFLFALSFSLFSKKNVFIGFFIYSIILIIVGITNTPSINAGSWLKLISFSMNIEFFMGVLVAMVFARLNKKLILPFLVLGIVAFLVGAAISNYKLISFSNSISRAVVFGIPSFFIVLAVTSLEKQKTIKVPAIFLKLGDASYSIYLLHLPLMAAFIKLVDKFHINNSFALHFVVLLFILGIAALGIAFNNLIEKPLIKKLNNEVNKHKYW